MAAVNSHILPATQAHFQAISEIYADGLDTGIATFETSVPTWEAWNTKYVTLCRFIIKTNNTIAGWAALSPISKRPAYKGVAECTIYVAKAFQGQGLGTLLLEKLIAESEKAGFWTLQASIFSENTASISLHQNCGFRVVGTRERIATRNGIWHDNILMEKRKSQ